MILKRLLSFAILSMLLLISVAVQAQDRTITGRVTDSAGNGLAGATITVKGTRTAVQSTADGSFTIKLPNGATRLVVTSAGFAASEITADGNTANIILAGNATNLNEVVVVAYGTRKKADLTSSITSVSSKDFQKGFIPSPEQLLQGKVAGLQITSGGGSAGGGSKIRIRGGASLSASNDPLVVIDGVPVEGNGVAGSGNLLSTINPNDIESVSVLKDASATALYGSRASNGVLIVTTKKGSKGKMRFNFNTQASFNTLAKEVKVLTGDQVRDIITKDATATGSNTYKSLLGTANTNWQNEIYRNAIGLDNNLSASGALGNIPFRASLGYLN